MKARAKRLTKWAAIGVGLLLAIGIIAPYLSVDQFAPRIRAALESALGRKVEIGNVHFSLFTGPGFSLDNVVIHEDPAIGMEPIAYVTSLQAVPRITPLFGGRLEFASIRLDDASINVAKTGSPSEPRRWNFEPLLNRSVIRAIPELHVRSGRINFKFGYTKSVFYLINTDLDIAPPSRSGAAWTIEFSGEPARTDRPARGFGLFLARGRWSPAGHLDMDVRMEKSEVGEMIALLQGSHAGIHGTVSARVHLAGPLDNINLKGGIEVQDVHRWDLMPPHGQGWPFRLAGRLNLPAQIIELESSSSGGEALPLAVRFRCTNYLSQPHWGASLNWNRFPIGPLMDVARHMGAELPPGLKMDGRLDGVLGFSGQGSVQGELDFHNASIAIPDSPPIRSEQAQLVFDGGHARLSPAVIRTAEDEQAQIEGDYDMGAELLKLTISTASMRLESLRAQVALAAVPWLEQVPKGVWKGQLLYQVCGGTAAECLPFKTGWTGHIVVENAQLPLPGLAEPVELEAAVAHLDGSRVRLERIRAQAGNIAFQGEYQYEPQAARPHRLRISIPETDAAELERLLMPTLRHSRGLFARALNLGRTPVPEWLADRHVDATLQIGSLHLGDAEARSVQAHLLWDVTRAEFANIRVGLEGGRLTGTLWVNLRGSQPVYKLEARCRDMEWKSGTVDAETVMETSGTGAELLARLHSAGTFVAQDLEMETLPDLESVSGAYELTWAQPSPLLKFSELQLVSDNQTYLGQGATQPDGRLLIQLSSGTKEMRMSGTLAELRLEEPVNR